MNKFIKKIAVAFFVVFKVFSGGNQSCQRHVDDRRSRDFVGEAGRTSGEDPMREELLYKLQDRFLKYCQEGNIELVRSMLSMDFGKNFEYAKGDTKCLDGNTPLHHACWYNQHEIVLEMMKYHIDVNIQNNLGNTALQFACAKGCSLIVDTLLENGADVGLIAKNGGTALHTACKKGHYEIAGKLIAKKANVNLQEDAPSHFAGEKSVKESYNYFGKEQGEYIISRKLMGLAPIHWACINGHIQVVRELLESVDLNKTIRNGMGDTPLHMACFCGHRDIVELLVGVLSNDEKNIRNMCGKVAYDMSSDSIQAILDGIVDVAVDIREIERENEPCIVSWGDL